MRNAELVLVVWIVSGLLILCAAASYRHHSESPAMPAAGETRR